MFEFHSRREYFDELVRCAGAARPGDSITLMSMVFDPTVPSVAGLIEALTAAAGRGVRVRLVIDAYSFLLNESEQPGPLLTHARIVPETLAGTFRQAYELLEALRRSGSEYFIINQPASRFSLPIAGRSHIKLALVNDRVFIGGCNLDHDDHIDIMTSWQDAGAAGRLRAFVDQVTAAGSVGRALGGTDQTFDIGRQRRIFVDSGRRNQSVIMAQAHELIDAASEHVTITCQYFPGGETAQRLLAAHRRGVKVTIHFSPPVKHGIKAPGHWLYNARERLRLPAAFFAGELPASSPLLHAKLIATDKGAMLGSHNYVRAGVALGTAEIALRVPDPVFARQAAEKITTQL